MIKTPGAAANQTAQLPFPILRAPFVPLPGNLSLPPNPTTAKK
jgi:hypothetical protein